MTLHVPAGSPWWTFAAAYLILFLHIAGGSVGIISGMVALLARKGARLHRIAGTTFFVSMLIMATIGATASPFLPVPSMPNVVAGVLTSYLVATGWMAVKRKGGGIGRFEKAGLGVALALVAAGDLRMIRRGGIFGSARIARHLWRMSTALFIASGSFFLGQQRVMPVAMRGSPWLFVPVIVPVLVMIFWLIRVRFKSRTRVSWAGATP